MLPTPSTSHVSFEIIYEPAEDSFLLLDTLSSEVETAWLSSRFKQTNSHATRRATPLVLEVGSGSGVVIAFLTANAAKIFGSSDILTLATDVNNAACKATQLTVQHATTDANPLSDTAEQQQARPGHGHYLASVTGDLCAPLRNGSVDVVVFNPPYVPTPDLPDIPMKDAAELPSAATSFETASHLLALSYAGGIDGMETTNRLLARLPELLTANRGVAYILLCAQNKPEEVKRRIKCWGNGWVAETVSRSGKVAGWEKLQILRIWRQ